MEVYVSSDFDSQVPTEFQSELGAIEFCFGDSQFGTAVPTKDGGFAVYETDSSGGSMTSGKSAKVFDSNGVMVASVSDDSLNDYIVTT